MSPRATLVPDSDRARGWASNVDIEFHEVRIHANAHAITLIFSELEVAKLAR
jgi:hypothetical protein